MEFSIAEDVKFLRLNRDFTNLDAFAEENDTPITIAPVTSAPTSITALEAPDKNGKSSNYISGMNAKIFRFEMIHATGTELFDAIDAFDCPVDPTGVAENICITAKMITVMVLLYGMYMFGRVSACRLGGLIATECCVAYHSHCYCH